jgi:hypothetical protein
MNTPAHAIVNLLLFRKPVRETHAVAIVAGALTPDAPMLIFYLWARLTDMHERAIWHDGYFDAGWQAVFDAFHSFPLLGLAWLLAWRARVQALCMFIASMLMHSLLDFPLHHDDAHRHFWPLSDFRFASPASYWDPAHYGAFAAPMELLLMVAGGAWLLHSAESPRLFRSVAALLFIYLAFRAFAMAMWK